MRGLVLITVMLALTPFTGCVQPDADPDPHDAGESRGATRTTPQHAWPAIEDARIRPGVQVGEIPGLGAGLCTSNFVFTSPDNGTLYLGTAAHCFLDDEIGAPVVIDGGVATGTLAYNSWHLLNGNTTNDGTCSVQAGNPEHCMNDFALIEIHAEDRHLVHPAVLHFGGPEGLADASGVSVGDKVVSYGNSFARGQTEPTNRKEGYVIHTSPPWRTNAYLVTPHVQGDSGSGVLTGDGRALGVFATVNLTGWNGIGNLDAALDYAREEGGVDVSLATWERFEDAVLLPGGARVAGRGGGP